MSRTDTVTLDELDAAIAAATPRLDAADQRLVQAIYRRLAEGVPADHAHLATAAALPREEVAARLAAWPGVFADDAGAVVGFWGLAIPEMPHRISFEDGASLHAWCAWDPLFIAPIAGRAEVATVDPTSGTPLTYTVDRDGIAGPDPDHVVSFLLPDDTWDEDVVGSFCHYVLHFADRTNGRTWVDEHPGTFLLPLSDAVELGRRHAVRLVGGLA